MPAFDPVTAGLQLGKEILTRIFPDPTMRAKGELALLELAESGRMRELTAAAGIIQAEAASEGVLTRNWRPVVMLVFTALVVAHWLGWTAPNVTQETLDRILQIIQWGIGGYVIGRSVEKTAKEIAPILKK